MAESTSGMDHFGNYESLNDLSYKETLTDEYQDEGQPQERNSLWYEKYVLDHEDNPLPPWEGAEAKADEALEVANNAFGLATDVNGRVIDARAQDGYIAIGDKALESFPPEGYTKAFGVTALGPMAMQNMQACATSIAIGRNAMRDSLMSRDNIAIGDSALQSVQAEDDDYNQALIGGSRNIAMGGNAGLYLIDGYNNVHIGRNVGQCQVSGRGVTAIGAAALSGRAPIGLDNQIQNGSPFGGVSDTYLGITAVGMSAAQECIGSETTALGGQALMNLKLGTGNVAVGNEALVALENDRGPHGGTETVLSIAGTYTQVGTTLTITANAHGLAVDDWASFQLLTGGSATYQDGIVDYQVAAVPDVNTFVITSPVSRTANGDSLLLSREVGTGVTSISLNNSVVGTRALKKVYAGHSNAVIGYEAGQNASTSVTSALVGFRAAYLATGINNSAALGCYAANNMPSLNQVTALGSSSLRYNALGGQFTDAFTNITGVGYDSRVTASNQVQLGGSGTTVYAYGAVQDRSDARDKYDVRDTALGLDFINKLRPVDFKWNLRGQDETYKKGERYHHGVIAQEVQGLIEDGTVEDFGGFQDHKVSGGADVLSVGYTEFIAPLIKAVQELSAELSSVKAELAALKG